MAVAVTLGRFDEFITLHAASSNASSTSDLPDLTLELRGDVVSAVAPVPEPGMLAALAAPMAILLRRKRA